ncbi:hypothetical protein COCC4DRAFT_151147 [Bipolaris maydis ATCC 48331]|uniref:Thioesterase domain-containing protein n=2 Tax=Cochliobolus heterostrophus TaxID=5016 RepID=M2UHI1_COCH5|nr:uncharacterized protein COCC4DRAFT_151147 [Bipolaris maydis ATCC 48331]EMD93151.1 hypothetical protein COCHEDRAFT_1098280 [Bipolaris maydis C5]ENI00255.1 hypothetical protein COCC4DRAFT_151147 [Bipolaris maydis ATCC 48331]KAJ6208024.1 hypothetical protein PSV09DRAFT_1098280 [Bipolaris maydis]
MVYQSDWFVSVGSDVNGGADRHHGGIIATLLGYCLGHLVCHAYEALEPPAAELTVKFKKPITTPSVFMVRAKVNKEMEGGWVEDGHGTVFAEGSATYVFTKIEEAKL